MYINNKHKLKVELRGYEYICSYNKDEITIDSKVNKYHYIRVKCSYCKTEYDVTYGSFVNKKNDCTHCCNEYNKSLAYHIQVELGEPLDKYWDWDKNKVSPYLISRRSSKRVYIKCDKTDYHEPYSIICANFTKGDRCPYCNVRHHEAHPKDSFAQYHIDNTDKDFIEKYWSDQNTISPWKLSYRSSKRIWIKCHKKDYHDDYVTTCDDFTRGNRCPQCCKFQGNVNIKDSFAQWGIINLGSDFLEKYWSHKNKLNPFELSTNTHKRIWIKCQEKDYHDEYITSCDNFTKGSRCSQCNMKSVHPKDSFGALYPEKAKYWSVRNKKSPFEVASFSNKPYFFTCRKCGTEFKRILNQLNQSDTNDTCLSCSSSKGEYEISTILNNFNINYVPQKQFDGLIGVKSRSLSYDFYLPVYNLLIEFQGKQHQKRVEYFHKTKEDFERQLEHDRRKREYAANNNIKLLEIWYWDFDNIESILEEHLR